MPREATFWLREELRGVMEHDPIYSRIVDSIKDAFGTMLAVEDGTSSHGERVAS